MCKKERKKGKEKEINFINRVIILLVDNQSPQLQNLHLILSLFYVQTFVLFYGQIYFLPGCSIRSVFLFKRLILKEKNSCLQQFCVYYEDCIYKGKNLSL